MPERAQHANVCRSYWTRVLLRQSQHVDGLHEEAILAQAKFHTGRRQAATQHRPAGSGSQRRSSTGIAGGRGGNGTQYNSIGTPHCASKTVTLVSRTWQREAERQILKWRPQQTPLISGHARLLLTMQIEVYFSLYSPNEQLFSASTNHGVQDVDEPVYVVSSIGYLSQLKLYETEKPYYCNVPLPNGRQSNIVSARHSNIALTNIRPNLLDYTLDKQGFEILEHDGAPYSPEDFSSDSWIEQNYYPLIENILLERFGNVIVKIFDHTVGCISLEVSIFTNECIGSSQRSSDKFISSWGASKASTKYGGSCW